MAAPGLKHAFVAAAVAASTACSIWAAIDDPYKGEAAIGVDSGASPPDAGAGTDADANVGTRVVDAGFSPYAIAAYGDTVYVVDDHAQVHVAYDAGTTFTTFWSGDGGDTFVPTNRIAASDAGVFWTVGTTAGSAGIRYCALDGGACGFLPTAKRPELIAASDSIVAWTDSNGGIARCATPLSQCTPTAVILAGSPSSIAVGQDGTVAWVFQEQQLIHFLGMQGRGSIPVPYKLDVLAADPTSNNLYWEGQNAIGFVPFDGLYPEAGTASTVSMLTSGAVPTQLFAAAGVAYWAFSVPDMVNPVGLTVSFCRFGPDAGCTSRDLANLTGKLVDQGVVATSKDVLSVIISPADQSPPRLFAWPAPLPAPGK